jgi:Tfp pilus assembly protein PilX
VSARRQSGVATLLVVMGLFFVVSMVAAYTSRNLIFEQRTSANQYRATQAFEAAEAGLEWAVAMLNAGQIDAQCTAPAAGSNANTFRQRYVADLTNSGAAAAAATPGCQLGAGAAGWACGCPNAGAPGVVVASGASPQPAFRVRFRDLGLPYPRFLTIESRGCTSPDETCLSQAEVRGAGSGAAALVSIKAALVPALAARPQAAVTVAKEVVNGLTGKAVNTDATSAGITVQYGRGTGIESLVAVTTAGSGSTANGVIRDDSLGGLQPVQVFERFFGMPVLRFASQPSTVAACSSSASCSFSQVLAVSAANPGRPVWVPGDLAIDQTQPLGTADFPTLLVVGGEVRVSANAQITGLLFSLGDVEFASGSSSIQGALITAGRALGPGSIIASYDRAVIDRIRNTQGTIVRVPGSWKDF